MSHILIAYSTTDGHTRKISLRLQEVIKRYGTTSVFAGKIAYPEYAFWDKQMIRLIMWMTNGPTDPQSVTEWTDWQQVDAFGRCVAEADT